MIIRTMFLLLPFLLALGTAQQASPTPYTVQGLTAYPECVAYDDRSGAFFTGSTTDGTIYRGELGQVPMSEFVSADEAAIPSAYGTALDDEGRLWVVGGPTGTVAVYGTGNGEVVATAEVPTGDRSMLNDVAIGPDGTAYVTDSFRPVLYAVTLGDDGTAELSSWLELQGTPIEYQPGTDMLSSINLNGIVATEDGQQLITVQMNTGKLYRIGIADRSVAEIDLGGETLQNGDGLALDGSTLYVVRIANEEIVTIDLASDLASGEIVGRFTHDQLGFPACAAVTNQGLMVVNTQFDQQMSGTPQIPFQLVSFPFQQVRSGTAGQDAQENVEGEEGTKDEPLEQQPPEDQEQGEEGQDGQAADDEQEDGQQQDGQQQDGQAAGGQEPPAETLISQGEGVYGANCARCHQSDGSGDVGPALAGNSFLQNATATIETIAFGRGAMPAFGTLSHEQLASVTSYIRTAWENDFGPVTVAQVQEVRTGDEGGDGGGGEDGDGGASAQQSDEDAPLGATEGGVREIGDYATVTAERLENPEPHNWLNYRRTYDGWGYSPLDQITTENVNALELAWTFSTGVDEGHESPTFVNEGIMYVTTPDAKVIALDAVTGEQLWEFQRDLPRGLTQLHPTNRGIGFWGDNVYVGTTDARLIALDARTGEPVWDVVVEDPNRGYYITHAPLVVDGVVMVGTSGGELGIRGFIAGYDAEDGSQLWKTYTVPGEGEPGNETWPADTWVHGGGSVWMTGTYDVDTGLAYWGVGNAAPWIGDARPGDNLWTTSTIALDVQTGELVHGFQYHHNDSWDWDEVVAPMLIDYEADGREIEGMVKFARNGYLWWLERTEDGIEFVDAKPYVNQNVFESIDPETGRPTYDQDHKPTFGEAVTFCPSLWGGRDWPPEAYNPDTGMVYIAANENLCGEMTGQQVAYQPGQSFTGAESSLYVREGWDHFGEIQAWDVESREMVWEHHFPDSHVWGQVLTTAGDLVFVGGTVDRRFRAFDARSGDVLWEVPTNSGVIGMPVSFAVDGVQYIAVQSGWGVDATRMQNAIGNAIGGRWSVNVPQGGVVWVFRLPQDGAGSGDGSNP